MILFIFLYDFWQLKHIKLLNLKIIFLENQISKSEGKIPILNSNLQLLSRSQQPRTHFRNHIFRP